jgi:hypothetical protein
LRDGEQQKEWKPQVKRYRWQFHSPWNSIKNISTKISLGDGTVYADKVDYGIYCGEWCIGRIYEDRNRLGPEELNWFWAFNAPSKQGDMRTSNRVATLEIAKAEFEAAWLAWKAWAKLDEVE